MPWEYLVADLVASLLIALGLAEALANTGFVPESWRFPNYGWVIFALGVALMTPCLYYLFGRVRTTRRAKSGKPDPARGSMP